MVDLVTYQVDYKQQQLLNTSNQTLFTLRRLAFCLLLPMKVGKDSRRPQQLLAPSKLAHSFI